METFAFKAVIVVRESIFYVYNTFMQVFELQLTKK